MATAPVGAFVYRTRLTYPNQRTNVTAGTNTVIAGQFVGLTGSSTNGVQIVSAATAGQQTIWGFTLAPGMAATAEPYTAPQGTNLNVIYPGLTEFVLNCVSAATPTIGSDYQLASSAGVPYLTVTTAAGAPLRVEQLYPDDSASDTGARYICTWVGTIQ